MGYTCQPIAVPYNAVQTFFFLVRLFIRFRLMFTHKI